MQPERPLIVPSALLDHLAQRFPGKPSQIGAWVRALSEAYVSERTPAPSGLSAAQYLSAYGRYYLPVNYLKFHVPLHELSLKSEADLGARETLRVLDAGAGLGTAGLSLLGYLKDVAAPTREISLTLWDRDARALSEGRELAGWWGAQVLPEVSLKIAVAAAPLETISAVEQGAPYDLIVLGNCLAEWARGAGAGVAQAARRIEELLALLHHQGALVVVEPALRATSRFLLEARDRLLQARAAHLYAPCLHEEPCPALARERDWCHERLDWQLPEALAAIDRAAGLQKQTLAFSYLTLRKAPGSLLEATGAVDAHHSWARVVSDVLSEKGKRGCIGCTEAGRRVYYEALERGNGRAAAAIAALRRGEVAAFAEGSAAGERVRLAPEAAPIPLGAAKETPCKTKS